jgi:enediyne biosynthesis protein E4
VQKAPLRNHAARAAGWSVAGVVLGGWILAVGGCASAPALRPASASVERPDDSFRDVTAEQGVRFQLGHGGRTPLHILDTAGCGAGWLDYDNDGYPDLLLIAEKQIALYHNERGKGFRDVTGKAGITVSPRGDALWMGCAAGDYDRDGAADLYISGYHGSVLYRNNRDGTFQDVTSAAGVRNERGWETSCGFADVNTDGLLDLYAARYVTFDATTKQFCDLQGVRLACAPEWYEAERGRLYLNRGDGTFRNATQELGLDQTEGRGLGVAFSDSDGDGRTDLYVANDTVACDLFRNGGRFRNMGVESGTAYTDRGRPQAGMGTDWGDYNNDGRPDLVVASFQREGFSLYLNEGGGGFRFSSTETGLFSLTFRRLGFGAKFLDYDNDGDLDLAFANGHVQDQVHRVDTTATYAQTAMLLENVDGREFRDVSERGGTGFRTPYVGRGLAAADYDNDGALDLLLVDAEGSPHLLRNQRAGRGNWLRVKLAGKQSNREGIGARLRATAGGKTFVRECQTTGSYLSAHDRRVHFGLGTAARVDQLEVLWPSGARSVLKNLRCNREVLVEEK